MGVEMASSRGPAGGTMGRLLQEFLVLSVAARSFVRNHPRGAGSGCRPTGNRRHRGRAGTVAAVRRPARCR